MTQGWRGRWGPGRAQQSGFHYDLGGESTGSKTSVLVFFEERIQQKFPRL